MAGELTDRQVNEVVYSLREIRELANIRREASAIASAIQHHTKMQEEHLNFIHCWMVGIIALMIMGVVGLIVLLSIVI